MDDISFSILKLDLNAIQLLETIRFDAYSINNFPSSQSFYSKVLGGGNYVVYGVFYKKELVGACYVTKTYNSLFIEQLFIAKEFQNTDLHLGSSLLEHVLGKKKFIEEYFDTQFEYSYLDNTTDGSSLYENMGYKPTANLLMRKRLLS